MKTEISIKSAIYLRAAEIVEIGHCKQRVSRLNGEKCWFDEANQFCYHGALKKAAIEYEERSFDYSGGGQWPMADFNDRPETTPAMVAAKLREQAFKE